MTSIFEPGTLLDQVELLEFLTSGGQAEIWRVKDINYGTHDLAVKLRHIPWEQRSDREFQRRETRMNYEIDLLAECKSNYIVIPHFKIAGQIDIDGEYHAYYGLVMDRAAAGSLDDFLKTPLFSTFPLAEKIRLLADLANGLKTLQHFKIVHNDIKPHNILMFKEMNAFLPRFADFGYAFRRGEPVVKGGTPPYMAPELLLNEGAPDFRSDLYSLGVLFFEIMTGRHPLERVLRSEEPLKAIQHFYVSGGIDFNELIASAGRPIGYLIERMCARDPVARPTINFVIDTLKKMIRDDPSYTAIQVSRIYPEIVDSYRWPHALHQLIDEHEFLIFLRGSSPDSDVNFLRDALRVEEFVGFCIFRTFGTNDYFLRIWVRPYDQASLDRVLERFKADRGGDYSVVETEYHWPEPMSLERKGIRNKAQAFEALLPIVKTGKAVTSSKGRRSPFITGESKKLREQHTKQKAIRSICLIRAEKDLPPKLAEVIGERLFKEISDLSGFHHVEVCVSPRGKGGVGEFVIFAESKDLHRFKHALEIANVIMRDLTRSGHNTYRTHFEMDAESAVESYDGRLLVELSEYEHSRWNDDEY